jgi:hypothetical protein
VELSVEGRFFFTIVSLFFGIQDPEHGSATQAHAELALATLDQLLD